MRAAIRDELLEQLLSDEHLTFTHLSHRADGGYRVRGKHVEQLLFSLRPHGQQPKLTQMVC